MGIIASLSARLGWQKRNAADLQVPGWLRGLGEVSRWSLPDGTQAEQQGQLYSRLSWIQVAVAAVAHTAATVPFSVQRRDGETLRDIPNHPFEVLLGRPNPFDSRFELLRDWLSYYRLTGNGYLWLSKADRFAQPDELFVLPSQCVTPVPDGTLGLAGYLFDSGYGAEIPLQPWEVCHLRSWNPLSRFVGLSPIEACQIGAGGDLAAQTWSANFYGKDNAKIPGALAFRDMVADPQWKQIKADIKDGWGGTNRGGPLMLRGVGEGGAGWIPMGLSQNDMQYLQSRTFTKEEIYALFAPGLASTLDVNATYANSSTGKAALIEFSVWPLLVAAAEKLSNEVLPCYDRRSPGALVGAFDDIRPTDRELELKEQAAAAAVLTIDELRQKYYQLDPLPGGRGARLEGEPLPGSREGGKNEPFVSSPPSLLRGEPLALPAPAATKAALRPDEAVLVAKLQAVFTGAADADLAETLRGALLAAMAVHVAAKLPAGIADDPPVYDWIGDFMPLALGLLAGGPGPNDGGFLGWLARSVVRILAEAKAWAVERLAEWVQLRLPFADDAAPAGIELVWQTIGDGRECPLCAHLDGTPKRLLPAATKPGTLHPYCRCSWQLAPVDVAAADQVEAEVTGAD